MERSVKSGAGRLSAIIFLLFLFSFLGWCMEKALFWFAYGENADRGFLTLPFCPIYGFSLLTVRLLFGLPVKEGERYPFNALRILLYGALSALVATAAELLTGLFFHELFGMRLWSYRGYPHEWRGYICLPMSVSWGVLIAMGMALLWTPLERRLSRAPTRILAPVNVFLGAAMGLDFAVNLIAIL